VEKTTTHHTTTVLRPFFQDHPGEPVPEDNFWTLWCKGRLTAADTPTIRLGATLSGLTSAHLHHPPSLSPHLLPSLPAIFGSLKLRVVEKTSSSKMQYCAY